MGTNKEARETGKFLDNLTRFTTDEGRERSDVLESLRVQGINPADSLQHFHQLLSEHAPTWKEQAAKARAVLVASFESPITQARQTRAEIIAEIRKVMESMRTLGSPVEAGAYHRKFEEARDEDLESLLQDIRFQRDLLLKQHRQENSNG